jgi:uncharacterized C2H2 Zn-finger protein
VVENIRVFLSKWKGNSSQGITMIIKCPRCEKEIVLRQKYLYHAGFSNLGVLYCTKCSTTLTFSSFDKSYTRIVREKHPLTLSDREKRKVEKHIRSCPCGGKFSFFSTPRCPFCSESLYSLTEGGIKIIELGDVIDGDKDLGIWI